MLAFAHSILLLRCAGAEVNFELHKVLRGNLRLPARRSAEEGDLTSEEKPSLQ